MTQKTLDDLDTSLAGSMRNDEMRESAGYRGVAVM